MEKTLRQQTLFLYKTADLIYHEAVKNWWRCKNSPTAALPRLPRCFDVH